MGREKKKAHFPGDYPGSPCKARFAMTLQPPGCFPLGHGCWGPVENAGERGPLGNGLWVVARASKGAEVRDPALGNVPLLPPLPRFPSVLLLWPLLEATTKSSPLSQHWPHADPAKRVTAGSCGAVALGDPSPDDLLCRLSPPVLGVIPGEHADSAGSQPGPSNVDPPQNSCVTLRKKQTKGGKWGENKDTNYTTTN